MLALLAGNAGGWPQAMDPLLSWENDEGWTQAMDPLLSWENDEGWTQAMDPLLSRENDGGWPQGMDLLLSWENEGWTQAMVSWGAWGVGLQALHRTEHYDLTKNSVTIATTIQQCTQIASNIYGLINSC